MARTRVTGPEAPEEALRAALGTMPDPTWGMVQVQEMVAQVAAQEILGTLLEETVLVAASETEAARVKEPAAARTMATAQAVAWA